MASFDAAAFLEEHCGERLLPAVLRTTLRVIGNDTQERAALTMHEGTAPTQQLATIQAEALQRIASDTTQLSFFGPQIVSEAITIAPQLVLLGEPGSGKSTALRYLSYVLAQAGLDQRYDLRATLPGWTLGRRLPVADDASRCKLPGSLRRIPRERLIPPAASRKLTMYKLPASGDRRASGKLEANTS